MVIEHEKQLLASAYGRFFVRRLRLHLYRKDIAQWKTWATSDDARPAQSAQATTQPRSPFAFLQQRDSGARAKQRRSAADDELATIFSAIE